LEQTKVIRARRKRFRGYQTCRLAIAIRIFLMGHSNGLDIMLGRVRFPDAEEIVMMLRHLSGTADTSEDLGVRVQFQNVIFYAQSVVEAADTLTAIIDDAGGMTRVVEVFQEYAKRNSEQWRALADWFYGMPGTSDGDLNFRLMRKYHKRPEALRRARDETLLQIADSILHPWLP
jgi:hypothetical protein